MELKFLSERLHQLSDAIDHVPSIDKYKMLSQIQDLHIIMTELDDRISRLRNECHTVEMPRQEENSRHSFSMGAGSESSRSEKFDYDFGG